MTALLVLAALAACSAAPCYGAIKGWRAIEGRLTEAAAGSTR